MDIDQFVVIGSFSVGVAGFFFGVYKHFSTRKFAKVRYELLQLTDFNLPETFFESLSTFPVRLTIKNIGNKKAEDVHVNIDLSTEIIDYTIRADSEYKDKQKEKTIRLYGISLNPTETITIFIQCKKIGGEINYIRNLKITHSEGYGIVSWRSEDDNFIYYGDKIAIRVIDGTFWQVNRDEDNKVMALAKHIKEWEKFEMIAADGLPFQRGRHVHYNDLVAIRFLASNSFVSVNLDEGAELVASVPWIKEWEKFTLIRHPNRPSAEDGRLRYGAWFALKACNQQFVTFDRDKTKQLGAWVSHLDTWEEFIVFKLSS